MVDLGEENGILDEREKEWIQNVFKLDDLTVRNIMTHNTEVSAVRLNADLETIEQLIDNQRGRSRYPVYDKNENDVIGIISPKDFFIGRRKNMGLKANVRPAYFVPEEIAGRYSS